MTQNKDRWYRRRHFDEGKRQSPDCAPLHLVCSNREIVNQAKQTKRTRVIRVNLALTSQQERKKQKSLVDINAWKEKRHLSPGETVSD